MRISDSGAVTPPSKRRRSRLLVRAQRHPRPHHRSSKRRLLTHITIAVALIAIVFLGARIPANVTAGNEQQPPSLFKVSTFSLPGLAGSVPQDVTVSRLETAAPPAAEDTTATEKNVGGPPATATEAPASGESVERVAQEVTDAPAAPAEARVRAARTEETIATYFIHVVQAGDTVSSVAAQYNIDPKYILWNNIDIISDQHLLTVGEKLQIPSVEGILHPVRLGQTLTEIAEQYGVEAEDIVSFVGNDLSDTNQLVEGRIILVPGGKLLTLPAPSERPTPPQAAAPEATSTPSTMAAAPQAAGSGEFIWPVVNNITSYFGPSHPLGIDIEAPYVPVAASRAGQVVFVGGDPCCSYGNYIIIQHDGGYETRYAHLSQFSVSLGQWVEQGQIIGISGMTGRSTGPHLHFEVIYNGAVVNPLSYLR